MSNSGTLAVLVILSLQTLAGVAQSGQKTNSADQPATAVSSATTLPAWLPVPIPPELYQKWRKYGVWDYKQQGFKYRDYAQFNFGATAGAAGLSQDSAMAIARASKPTPDDINRLDTPELLANFNRNVEAFDKLRAMADSDSHVVRIAPDYTLLDTDTSWPRQNLGFTEIRWNEYRSNFEKLSLQEGIVRTDDFPGAIFFIAKARGLCTGGSSAGFVYSTKALTPVSKSPRETLETEARRNSSRHYAYVFKSLRPNWYAFYEVDW
jgi:hypothetical protein